MTRAADIEIHPAAPKTPGLTEALSQIGHSQIRARTTIGGSIAHADPAAELPALLLALDGQVTLRSRDRGERIGAAEDFFRGHMTTARAWDELLMSVVPRASGISLRRGGGEAAG